MTDRSVPRRPMPAQPIPGARRRLAPAPRRSAWHSIAGYAALAAACVVLAAVTFLVVAAPTDFIRDQLVREVKQRTGRELAIAGPVSARFFPSPGVRLADVTISGPEDSGASLATVKSVDVEVSAWSFLSRRVEARRVVLREPVIDLAAITRTRREEVGAAQEAGRPAQPLEGRAANAGAVPGLPAINPKVAASLDRLGLGRLRIVNGTVKYQDAKTGTRRQIGALDLDVSLKGPDAPLLATGSGVWRGEKIAIEASLGSLRGFILGERTPARIALSGQPLAVRYVGTLTAGGAVDGRIEVAAPSQAALQAWLGTSRGLAGPEPVSLSATLAGTAERLSVTGLDAAAGTLTAQGEVTIATGGERPRVEGRLHLSELDFGNILLRRDGAVAPLPRPMRPAGEALPVPTQTTEERRPQATADPGKRLGGRDWSDQAFDVALLGLADAELQLSVDRLAYRDVQTGPARLAVALKDKVATVTLQNMQLYGGQGRGVLTLHGTGDALASEVQLVVSGISARPLLKDSLHVDWLEGRGALNLVLAGRGHSERQMVAGLSGRVVVSLADGTVAGIDVPKILDGLAAGRLSGLAPTPEDRTAFEQLAATFVIADGVARNQDLRLTSSRLAASGAGTVNLPLRHLDYTVHPKVVSPAGAEPGKGAGIDLSGLEIPVQIVGPWDKPAFRPDLKGLLASDQAAQAIKRIGRNLKSQEVQDALRGLLSGEQRAKPRDLIEKLLKKE